MADNFDLKKFLKESKALENLNPVVAKENLSEGGIRERIREYILAELSDKELEDATVRVEKGDSTDLALHMAGIKENDPDYEGDLGDDPDENDPDYSYFNVYDDLEDQPTGDYYNDEYELEEAKKKEEEEVEDVEVTDTETEEAPAEEAPAEEAPAAGGGLEDIAANMEGTENELMKNLMDALSIAKGMNNEKLETQIGNTLKFFVSEYIGNGGQE
jgi:hypothetical protein